MKTSVTVKLFSPSVDKKANAGTTAVTLDVGPLATVIEKHDETSGWNSSTDKDQPSTRAICAASQPRLSVCLYIPLPPTKHR